MALAMQGILKYAEGVKSTVILKNAVKYSSKNLRLFCLIQTLFHYVCSKTILFVENMKSDRNRTSSILNRI